MAEGEGFEPPRACALPVFKTGAFNHSAIPPALNIINVFKGFSQAGIFAPVCVPARIPGLSLAVFWRISGTLKRTIKHPAGPGPGLDLFTLRLNAAGTRQELRRG